MSLEQMQPSIPTEATYAPKHSSLSFYHEYPLCLCPKLYNRFRLNRAGIGAVAGPREHGNETSNFINTQIHICTLSTHQETSYNNEIFFTTKKVVPSS